MNKQVMAQSLFTLTAIIIVTALIAINSQRHKPLPVMYITCNRDQVSEVLHNQPHGISAAIAAHCVLHSN